MTPTVTARAFEAFPATKTALFVGLVVSDTSKCASVGPVVFDGSPQAVPFCILVVWSLTTSSL